MTTQLALALVSAERRKQDEQWGEHQASRLQPSEILAILTEEVGEAARCLNDGSGPKELREELIQIAAIAVAWIEELKD